jgi:predicted O-methyltransferase YrrM
MKLEERYQFGLLLNKLGLTGNAVEIGVAQGNFSKALLSTWQGRKLYLIDPWEYMGEDYTDIFNISNEQQEQVLVDCKENLKGYEDRYEIIRATSEKAVMKFSDSFFDFVYIDANHAFKYAEEDIKLWYPKIKKGGILAGHDYVPDTINKYGSFGVKSAVDNFAKQYNYKVELTTLDDYLC